jgi:ATP-binding cassette, subfamily B, multidrug efflux pump
MLSGWRGTNAGSMHAPTRDHLSDDTVVGKVYDNRVVMRLLTYLVPYRRDALITLAAMLVYTGANVALPFVIMYGIDWGINSGDPWRLHVVGLIFFGVALVHFSANYLQLVSIAKVGQGVLYSLRTELFNHLQSLSPAFFHRTSVGRIMSRSQSDIMQLQETFELLVTTIADFLSLGGIIVAMLFTDWQLALVSVGIIPPLFFVLGYWQRFARHSFMRIRRAIALVNGEYNQNITGVRVVQSLNRQEENLRHFNGLNQEFLDANLEASRLSPADRRALNGDRYGGWGHPGGRGVAAERPDRVGCAGRLRSVGAALFRTHPPVNHAIQPDAAGDGGGSADFRAARRAA